MSSGKSKKSEKIVNFDFIQRFTEVCGTSQPAEIARLLNISYNAAKNYLSGRLPDAKVLITISERTEYSIHWLLTGIGKKFVESNLSEDTLLLSDQLRKFVRRECAELIGETLGTAATAVAAESTADAAGQTKVVVLTPDKIREEKILDENVSLPGKQQ